MTTCDIIFTVYVIVGVLLIIPTYICTRLSVRLWPNHSPFIDQTVMIIPSLFLCLFWGFWPVIAIWCGFNYGFEKLLDKFVPKK